VAVENRSSSSTRGLRGGKTLPKGGGRFSVRKRVSFIAERSGKGELSFHERGPFYENYFGHIDRKRSRKYREGPA